MGIKMGNYNLTFPLLPFGQFTVGTPTIPKFYWDVYSQEQRIKHICEQLYKLIQYSDTLAEGINQLEEEISEIDENVKKELAAFKEDIEKELDAFKAEVKELISELSVQAPVWDVTLAEYVPSKVAMRNMFNDVTDRAYTIDEFNNTNATVESLSESGLNVRGWAVVNRDWDKMENVSDFYKYEESEN